MEYYRGDRVIYYCPPIISEGIIVSNKRYDEGWELDVFDVEINGDVRVATRYNLFSVNGEIERLILEINSDIHYLQEKLSEIRDKYEK